jgi:hypothetical protein
MTFLIVAECLAADNGDVCNPIDGPALREEGAMSRSVPQRPTPVRAETTRAPGSEVDRENEGDVNPNAPAQPEWGRRMALFLWLSSFGFLIFYELLMDLLKFLKRHSRP